MSVANVLQGNTSGLSQAMKIAQAAIHLPEIQEMLHTLSEYNLGIFMPHMHDEKTGGFMPLPNDLMQVESSLEVSFQPTKEIAGQGDRFLPVGWFWRAGASSALAVCEMIDEGGPDDNERYVKHKMLDGV